MQSFSSTSKVDPPPPPASPLLSSCPWRRPGVDTPCGSGFWSSGSLAVGWGVDCRRASSGVESHTDDAGSARAWSSRSSPSAVRAALGSTMATAAQSSQIKATVQPCQPFYALSRRRSWADSLISRPPRSWSRWHSEDNGARVHKKTAAAGRKAGVDRVDVCWGKSYVRMAGRMVGSTARYGFG